MFNRWFWMAILLLGMAACRQASAPALGSGAEAAATAPLPVPIEAADNGELLRLAEQALREQRLYSPAGDNAVEFYLAARDRTPDDGAVRNALVEMQPYLLIATEQALERRDTNESARLLALVQRMDPQAPALARLQGGLQRLQASAPAEPLSQPPMAVVPPARPLERSVTADSAPTPSNIDGADRSARTTDPVSAMASATTVAVPVADAPPATPPPPAVETPVSASPARTARASATPRLLQDAQPRYPLPALRARMEGKVEVAFVIRPDGSVGDVRLVSANPQGVFDASALAVATRWRFEASGQSHRSQRTVQFRLPN